MRLFFKQKEIKLQKVDIDNVTFCYLMSICEHDSELWDDFKLILKIVEERVKSGKHG